VWDSFERRYEAEHYLGPQVRARALIEQLAGLPDDATEEAFRSELARLSYVDLRAFYNRVVELTGGPSGQAEENAEAEHSLATRDRLLALRAVSGTLLNEAARARADHLTRADAEFVRACAPIDERYKSAVIAAFGQKGTDSDADALAAAARDYAAVGGRAPLSGAGQRLLGLRVARALDALARACDTNGRQTAAVTHFAEAARRYTEAGEEHLAAESRRHRDEAAQRKAPNADTRLEQLLAELERVRPPSTARVNTLVELAKLAHGNHDDFEAERWLLDAIAELAGLGYPIPEDDGVDVTVQGWIAAIPPAPDNGEDAVYFLRRFNELLTLQTKLAGVQAGLALSRRDGGGGAPGVSSAEEAELRLNRLADIAAQAPSHGEAVRARLAAQLGRPGEPDFGTEEVSARGHETRRVFAAIEELRDLTGKTVPPDRETIRLWRQKAEACVAGAEAFGDPVIVALALGAAAQVELAADDIDAAMDLLRKEYEHVAGVAGQPAATQAIMALTMMAKIQLGTLKDWKAALKSAVTGIKLIERDRYRVSAPFQQAALLAPHADLFTAGIFAAWKDASGATRPDSGDYDPMLWLMELAKARASIRRLFLPATNGDPELDRQLAHLSEQIHTLDPVMAAVGPDTDQQAQRTNARQAQQPLRRDRLQLWDRRAISTGESDASVPPVRLAGLQAVLDPDEAIISYYWLNSAALLVTTITASQIAVERKVLTEHQGTLLKRMIGVLGSLTGSNRGLDAEFIGPLAAVLTPVDGLPLLEGKQRLIVSPHRLLHWYPFAALPYQGNPLVRSFAIRYAPNLTSLLVPAAPPSGARVAVLAVSDFPGRPGLGRLSRACQAAENVAAIYAEAGIPAELLLEPTRDQVLGAMRDGTLAGARCLHVDTHGYSLVDDLSKDAPLESVLELADNSVDGYEIASADLKCEVVVLTACFAGQRAIGGRGLPEQPGDELFGVSAAFLDARCGSVLAPIWPAEDGTISPIITMFHRNLANGAPADIALAQAQRAFLDTASYVKRSAYYWAPLTLTAVGRPRPVD
jgi:CHAT domain-containing protein